MIASEGFPGGKTRFTWAKKTGTDTRNTMAGSDAPTPPTGSSVALERPLSSTPQRHVLSDVPSDLYSSRGLTMGTTMSRGTRTHDAGREGEPGR